jgi:hypothetical protein
MFYIVYKLDEDCSIKQLLMFHGTDNLPVQGAVSTYIDDLSEYTRSESDRLDVHRSEENMQAYEIKRQEYHGGFTEREYLKQYLMKHFPDLEVIDEVIQVIRMRNH